MVFSDFLISQYNPSYTGWAIQNSEIYAKVQKEDSSLQIFAKCTFGAVPNLIFSMAAMIELAIAGCLTAGAKLFFFTGCMSKKSVAPFSNYTNITLMYLCMAASRIATNFLGEKTLLATEKVIKAQLMPEDSSLLDESMLLELSKKIESKKIEGSDRVWAMEAACQAINCEDPSLRTQALELFLAIVESKTGYLPAYHCALDLLNDPDKQVCANAAKILCRLYDLGYNRNEISPLLLRLPNQSYS